MNKIGIGYSNGIGNFLLFTTALQAIATLGTIDLVFSDTWKNAAREPVELIARNLPFINRIVGFPSEFNHKEYDKIFMSHHSLILDPFLQYVHGNQLLNPRYYTAWPHSFLHERDYYLFEIRRDLGYKGPLFDQYMPISDTFPFKLSDKPKICISNGWLRTVHNKWQRKAWPHYRELIETLLGFYPDIQICLVGGEDDMEWSKSVVQTDNAIEDYCGKLNILETAHLINKSEYVISTDTSIAHIADALRKKGVILFGSTLTSKNGPLNGTMEIIRSPMPCAPCQNHTAFKLCTSWDRCMAEIEPGLVMSFVRKSLTHLR